MPTFDIVSPSGRRISVRGDSMPSETELDEIFNQVEGIKRPSPEQLAQIAVPQPGLYEPGVFGESGIARTFQQPQDEGFLGTSPNKFGDPLAGFVNPEAPMGLGEALLRSLSPITALQPVMGTRGQLFGPEQAAMSAQDVQAFVPQSVSGPVAGLERGLTGAAYGFSMPENIAYPAGGRPLMGALGVEMLGAGLQQLNQAGNEAVKQYIEQQPQTPETQAALWEGVVNGLLSAWMGKQALTTHAPEVPLKRKQAVEVLPPEAPQLALPAPRVKEAPVIDLPQTGPFIGGLRGPVVEQARANPGIIHDLQQPMGPEWQLPAPRQVFEMGPATAPTPENVVRQQMEQQRLGQDVRPPVPPMQSFGEPSLEPVPPVEQFASKPLGTFGDVFGDVLNRVQPRTVDEPIVEQKQVVTKALKIDQPKEVPDYRTPAQRALAENAVSLSQRLRDAKIKAEGKLGAMPMNEFARHIYNTSLDVAAELVDLGKRVYVTGMDKAKWVGEMVRHLGEEWRPVIEETWGRISGKEQEQSIFTTDTHKQLSNPASIGFNVKSDTKVDKAQLRARLLKGKTSEEQAIVNDALAGEGKVTLDEAAALVREKTPQVEVHSYGMEGKVSEAKKEYDRMTHEWFDAQGIRKQSEYNDALDPNEADTVDAKYLAYKGWKVEDIEKARQYAKLQAAIRDEPRDTSPRATSYYKTISALPTDEPMPEWTASKEGKNVQRVDVVISKQGDKRWKELDEKVGNKTATSTERDEWYKRETGQIKDELWQPDNLHENLPNTPVWNMIQYVTGPKGEKIAVIVENQGSWIQAKHAYESALKKGKTEQEAYEASVKAGSGRGYRPNQDHPLLQHAQRLGIKAVIDQARKEGATHIVVSDAETAMMTEGHDLQSSHITKMSLEQVLGAYRYDLERDKNNTIMRDYYGDDWKQGKYMKHGELSYPVRVDKPEANTIKDYPQYAREMQPYYEQGRRWVAQEPGMRLNYDAILPKIAEELTGQKGEKVSIGEHKNAFGPDFMPNEPRVNEIGEPLVGQQPRSNLIFRNPDGTPKTDVSGMMYDISGGKTAVPLKQPTLYGKDKGMSASPVEGLIAKLEAMRGKGPTGGSVGANPFPEAFRHIKNTVIDFTVAALKAGYAVKEVVRRVTNKFGKEIGEWVKEFGQEEANKSETKGIQPRLKERANEFGGVTVGEPRLQKTSSSLKNEEINEQRRQRGLSPILTDVERAWPDAWKEAMLKVKEQPDLPERIVEEMKTDPRPLRTWEVPLMVREVANAQLKHDMAADRLRATPKKDGPQWRQAVKDELKAAQEYDELSSLMLDVGSESGAAFNMRKAFVQDYTNPELWVRQYKAVAKERFTKKEETYIRQQVERLKELAKDEQSYNAELPKSEKVTTAKERHKNVKAVLSWMEQQREQIRKSRKGNVEFLGLDTAAKIAYEKVLTAGIEAVKGGMKLEDAIRRMVVGLRNEGLSHETIMRLKEHMARGLQKGELPKEGRKATPEQLAKRAEFRRIRNQLALGIAEHRRQNANAFQKGWYKFQTARDVSTNLMASMDLSAPRQMLFGLMYSSSMAPFTGRRAVVATIKPLGRMFQYLMSEEGAGKLQEALPERDNWKNGYYKRAELAFTELEAKNHTKGEENAFSFFDELAQEAFKEGTTIEQVYKAGPRLLAKGVRASNRAFNGALNWQRAELFDYIIDSEWKDRRPTDEELKVIGNFVNVLTGRGHLSPSVNKALVNVMWAPKLAASRAYLTVGQPLLHRVSKAPLAESIRARKVVLKGYLRMMAAGALYWGIGQQFSDRTETDPTSSDFGKIVRHNTRLDPWGGLTQPFTLESRLRRGEIKTAKGSLQQMRGEGKSVVAPKARHLVMDYLASKVRPDIGAVWDFIEGETYSGERRNWRKPEDYGKAFAGISTPLSWQDVHELAKDVGWKEAAVIEALQIFGMGVNTWEPKQKPTPDRRGREYKRSRERN